ncbi:MAG: pyridoxamine 5'-phosphate oxidase family protein [Microthrixaceae bacterium]|jgi:nitroimidazol reductase NimA-like FMN-containing flavoprotein (pyridoxamine 5'-phosphate oxidase superfamily)|nr:pyridoxamine 5'-phosphate oxidase family protein [Actinomycetota bacterium]
MPDIFDNSVDWAGLEVLSVDQCIERLRSAPIGRLGFLEAGEPVILPVNYAWHERTIVFRTAQGGKLSAAVRARPVCFEVDAWDDASRSGWSVVAKGSAEEVIDEDEVAALNTLGVRPWSRPELRVHWVRIRVGELTGRELH